MSTTHELIHAIKTGDRVRVEQLLEQDSTLANVKSDREGSAVLLACYYQQPEIARLLVSRGAELDIFEAAASGSLERVIELATHQPGLVNAFAPDGFQPLGLAAFFGHLEVVQFLLSQGAEPNSPSRNDLHVIALHSAAAGRHLAVTQALLAHGAEPNTAQAGGFTPLHAAAQNGQLEMVRLLLRHRADPDARSGDGETPLSLALKEGHAELAAYLRDHGANA